MNKKTPQRFTIKNIFRKRYLVLVVLVAGLIAILSLAQPPDWWQFSLTEQITQQPIFNKKNILLATNHGTVLAVHQRTGQVIWELKHEKDIASQPFLKNDKVYTSYIDGTVVAINPDTGEFIWQYKLPDSKQVHTGLLYSETTLIFGDSGGMVHGLSLSDGREKWSLQTPNPDSVDQLLTPNGIVWFGSVIMDRSKLYVIRTHGYIAEINPNTGKLIWEQKVPGTVIGEPLLTRSSLFISTDQVPLVSLSRRNGELYTAPEPQNATTIFCQVSYTQKGILTDLSERVDLNIPSILPVYEQGRGEQIIQVDKSGKVVSYDRATLRPKWQVELNYEPKRCFFDQEYGLYLGSATGTLTKVDVREQRVRWQQQLPSRLLSIFSVYRHKFVERESQKKYYYTNFVLVSDDQENFFRINPQTGEVMWSSKIDGSMYVPPVLHFGHLFIVTTNGGLYRLDPFTGKPDLGRLSPKVQATPVSQTVKEGEVFELKVKAPSDRYSNPYTAVDLSAEFINVENRKIQVHGFYYDKGEWRVRFNPPTDGRWQWTLHWRDPFQNKELSGSFTSERSYSVLQADPQTAKWLTKDGKTIFPVAGINDCFADLNQDGSPLNDWFTQDGSLKIATTSGEIPQKLSFNSQVVPMESYLDTYRNGFNLFRQNVSNCSPPLYYAENFLYSKYLSHEGKQFDALSQQLFQRGYSVWFTMFSFSLPFDGGVRYPDERFALENYIKYVVARFGAYVDVWEISNEAVASDEYVRTIAQLIEKNDPYKRLISVSWEKPQLDSITLIAPHWYQSENDNESDLATITQINKFSEYKKPVVFGEHGNQERNWDPSSAHRMRVRTWTAFFHQAGLVFWNQSSTKDYYNPTFQNSNIYLGEEERNYQSVFLQLTQGLPVSLVPQPDPPRGSGIRPYALKNETLLLYYIFNSNVEENSTTVITNTLAGRAKAEWFDTKTGELLRAEEVDPEATLTSPPFTRDIFVKLSVL